SHTRLNPEYTVKTRAATQQPFGGRNADTSMRLLGISAAAVLYFLPRELRARCPQRQPARTPALHQTLVRQSLSQDSKYILAHDGADFALGEALLHQCLGYQAHAGGVKRRGGCSIKIRAQANMLYTGDLDGALDGASDGGGIGS